MSKSWSDNCSSQLVLKHYGYGEGDTQSAKGFWPNDGTAFEKLGKVQELIKTTGSEKKRIRIVFDYDPDYPRALIQIWGLDNAASDFSTDAPNGKNG